MSDIVDYHSIIGGGITSKAHAIWFIDREPNNFGQDVAWITGQVGCVAASALTFHVDEEGFTWEQHSQFEDACEICKKGKDDHIPILILGYWHANCRDPKIIYEYCESKHRCVLRKENYYRGLDKFIAMYEEAKADFPNLSLRGVSVEKYGRDKHKRQWGIEFVPQSEVPARYKRIHALELAL